MTYGTQGLHDREVRTLVHDGVRNALDPAFGPANDPGVVAVREAMALAEPARPATRAHDDLPLEASEAPLRRYLAWQVRDFVRQRAVMLVPLALLGLYVGWEVAAMLTTALAQTAPGAPPGLPLEATLQRNFANLSIGATAVFTAFATAIATFGIVARERERGLQRFLFAKPVGVVPYYLQKLGVAFVGTLVVTAIAVLLAGVLYPFTVPVAALAMLAPALATMVAGTIFLVSTLVRFDAPLALFLTALNVPLWAVSYEGAPWWIVNAIAQLHWVLPPAHLVGAFIEPGGPMPPAAVAAALMAAYGVACVLAGLVVLRRRSIIV